MKIEIIILPHIVVSDELEIGNFKVFSSSKASLNANKTIVSRIERLVGLYRNIDGKEVQGVTLLIKKKEGGKLDFAPLNKEEREQARKTINILSYCLKEHLSNYLCQDNFIFEYFTFETEKDFDKINFSQGGRAFNVHLLDNLTIQIPPHVQPWNLRKSDFDLDLLEAFNQCLLNGESDDIRVLQAIDWFNQSQLVTPLLDDNNRLILLSIAFETLLISPEVNITKYFANSLQIILGTSKKLENWAKEFYDIRSSIVHGRAFKKSNPNTPPTLFNHISHLFLARIIFKQCVTKLLILMHRLDASHIYHARIDNIEKFLVSNKDRINSIKKITDSILKNKGARNSKEEGPEHDFNNYLMTIHDEDTSLDRADCDKALKALCDFALNGIPLVEKEVNSLPTNTNHKSIIDYYKEELIRVGSGNKHFATIGDYDSSHDDAFVRGQFLHANTETPLDFVLYAVNKVLTIKQRIGR